MFLPAIAVVTGVGLVPLGFIVAAGPTTIDSGPRLAGGTVVVSAGILRVAGDIRNAIGRSREAWRSHPRVAVDWRHPF